MLSICILKLITATIVSMSVQIDLIKLVRKYLTCELNLHLFVEVFSCN